MFETNSQKMTLLAVLSLVLLILSSVTIAYNNKLKKSISSPSDDQNKDLKAISGVNIAVLVVSILALLTSGGYLVYKSGKVQNLANMFSAQ
jgi:hypothetical protein